MKGLTLFFSIIVLNSCNPSKIESKLESDKVLESKFEILTQNARKTNTTIIFRLDTLTNFSWDTAVILTPYFNIGRLENNIKVDLTEIKNTKISNDEVSNVIAFIRNGKLINFIDLPRGKGDFSSDTSTIYTQNNCIFELIATDHKFQSGQSIVTIKKHM